MRAFLVATVALAAIAFGAAQDDGQYRPELYAGDNGQYRGSDEGRYLQQKYAQPYYLNSNFYNKKFGSVYPAYQTAYQPAAYRGAYQPAYQYQTAFQPAYQSAYQQAYQPAYYSAFPSYRPFATPSYAIDQNSIELQPVASTLAAASFRPPFAYTVPIATGFASRAAETKPAAAADTKPKATLTAQAQTLKPVVVARAQAQAYSKPVVYQTLSPLYANKQYTAERYANIVRQENELNPDSYHYLYQTDNGIVAEESGNVDASPNGVAGTRARGFYEYIGDDGVKYRVDYTADENGFRPTGAHLP